MLFVKKRNPKLNTQTDSVRLNEHCYFFTLFSIVLLQCNELNRGHPTLISQSQVMFVTKESGFGSLQTNQKREHFFKFQSVGFLGGPDSVRCTVVSIVLLLFLILT